MKARSRHSIARIAPWALVAACTLVQPALADGIGLRLSTQLERTANHTTLTTPSLPGQQGQWSNGAARWMPGTSACEDLALTPWDRLALADVLAVTLCKSPVLRQALAVVAEQTAGVDLSEAARGPRWTASAEFSGSRNFNSSGSTGSSLSASLGLRWVLFDFGLQNAELRAARETLSAAMADQNNAVLESVREAVRLYGEATVAWSALNATGEAETAASRTADAALARYQAQVGNQIDNLQAQTALAQATLDRVRALDAWEKARGDLALAMGATIEQPMKLADWEQWMDLPAQPPDLEQLQREARAQHPRLRASQAQISSLKSRLSAVQAENRGSVSLSASAGASRDSGAAGSGTSPAASGAVMASIPIFNRREFDAQQRQALARISAQEAELETVARDVDRQLWQAHRALLSSRFSLRASERLMSTAGSAYSVALGRYRAGVGSILELLGAQSALASARRERVASQVEALTAQTNLSLAVGRIGPAAP